MLVLFLLMATSTKAAEMPPFSAEGSWTASSMLPFCKSEDAAKRGGPCTGYVVAIYDEMRSRSLRTWIAVTSGPGREARSVEEVRARGGCVMTGQMTINEIRKTVIDWIEQHWDEYLRRARSGRDPQNEPNMYEMSIDALRNAQGCSTPAPIGYLP